MQGFLVDSNVWLALSFLNHPHHGAARQALVSASHQAPWLLCRATQQSFLRLASTPVITAAYDVSRLTNRDALQALEALMALHQVALIEEPPGVMECWARLGAISKAAPKLWMDAYLAAVAITGGWTLLSLDRDVLQFESQGLQCSLLAEP
ncbi:MAG: PIN domain-containing protein [Cyanobacteria bacterium M_surface_7_m2_040]|nr:PIN domain-containing protein [Cyanobacteria bacterium M_surface_7_m2_040]